MELLKRKQQLSGDSLLCHDSKVFQFADADALLAAARAADATPSLTTLMQTATLKWASLLLTFRGASKSSSSATTSGTATSQSLAVDVDKAREFFALVAAEPAKLAAVRAKLTKLCADQSPSAVPTAAFVALVDLLLAVRVETRRSMSH